MANRNFEVRYHNFVPVEIKNGVILAKCDCCVNVRYAVFLAVRNERKFYYHGHDLEYAQKLFNYLVQKQNQQVQDR